jgi:hypothetical protein
VLTWTATDPSSSPVHGGVNVFGAAACVVGQGDRCAANDVHRCSDASATDLGFEKVKQSSYFRLK